MPAKKKRTPCAVSIWMPAAQHRQLAHLSRVFGRSRSAIVCTLIDEVAAGRLKTERLPLLAPQAFAGAGTAGAESHRA